MKKSHKKLIIAAIACFIFLAFLLIIAFTYPKKKNLDIIMIPKVSDEKNDFWMTMIAGAESAAKEYEVNLKIKSPDSESNYNMQERLILDAINEKPDVIVISPIDYYELTDTIKKVKENKITLILLDSNINEDLSDCFIETNNYEAGKILGEYVNGLVNEDSNIAIVSHVKGTSTAVEREEGVRDGIDNSQDLISKVVYSDSDYQKAYNLTKDLVQNDRSIDIIVGLNLYSTVGVARAIEELGLQETIRVVGFDNDEEGIGYLENGTIQALLIQRPFNMGYLGIEKAVSLYKKKHVERKIDSGSKLITQYNIYDEENEKLLFPF